MTGQRDLLVEIGTEELPPRALDRLARAFANGVENGLREAGLAPAQTHRYATPRRLAVIAAGVPLQQAERVVERWGPPLGQAFDAEGNPTKAALGFAAAAGASVEALEQVDSPKGKRLYYRWTEPGRAAA
nr:glycine--tRNA ligase subunit beta [Gammaproteobacteria bacterium]NIR88608.1 glycine--tRNA ligase subunit beta [Gammaproteobacteria bacterium]